MKTLLIASIGTLAVAISTASLATSVRENRLASGAALLPLYGDQEHQLARDAHKHDQSAERDHRRDREQIQRTQPGDVFDRGMQAVSIAAGPGQPGDGWRYFSDPAAGRAVVISPQGEYFLSLGKGLRRVAVTQPRS